MPVNEVDPQTLRNFLATASDLLNALAGFSWDGIGVIFDPEEKTLDALVDCFRTKRRIELSFGPESVSVRLVGPDRVYDLGHCKRPYGIVAMVNWLVSD